MGTPSGASAAEGLGGSSSSPSHCLAAGAERGRPDQPLFVESHGSAARASSLLPASASPLGKDVSQGKSEDKSMATPSRASAELQLEASCQALLARQSRVRTAAHAPTVSLPFVYLHARGSSAHGKSNE